MNARNDTPWVLAVAYSDDESAYSLDYAQRVDVEFQKFAASGRSLLVASGDQGVGCTQPQCKHNLPNFPASTRASPSSSV
jgi:tripeptidyl-peptidase-1